MSFREQPQKCVCFNGFCLRHLCLAKSKTVKLPRVPKPHVRKEEADEFNGAYRAKPNDLRFWERVWRSES